MLGKIRMAPEELPTGLNPAVFLSEKTVALARG